MTITKAGNAGIYGFQSSGALSTNTKVDDTNYLAWHLGLGDSIEVTIHGKLDCYVNGVLVKGSGTITYTIQPDDTYVGVERTRPHRATCSVDGFLFSIPALATDGTLLLTVTPNAGCKGTVVAKINGGAGMIDRWGAHGSVPDRKLATAWNQASRREISVDLKTLSGSLKVLKFPMTAARACDQWGGLYPATGDMNDFAFRIWGFTVNDCDTVTPPDCPFESNGINCSSDCAALFAGNACSITTCQDYQVLTLSC